MRPPRLVAALALAALAAGACRSSPESATARTGGRPVLFVGLDGADWEMLDPLMARGTMPILRGLVAEGQAGALATEHPPLSPIVWTTMMTGVSPLRHGILDFTRFSPATGAREPITSEERQLPAVWNMAGARGRTVAVLGLWATWPAERVNGLLVADRLFSFQRQEAVPRGSVFPAEREAWAQGVVQAQDAATGLEALRAYVPTLDPADYARLAASPEPWAHPVTALRRILVETRVYHTLALEAFRDRRPDLGIVYFQGTDAIGHVFAPYAPPRQPSVGAEDFARYSGVAERYFGEVDGMLGQYRDLARERGALLVVASDHGFLWGEGRPQALSSIAAPTAGRWHRDLGIFVVWDPWAPAPSGRPPHAGRGGVAQVCATLLAGLGLPRGAGLAGPALGGLLEVGPPVDYAALPWRTPASTAPAASGAGAEQVEQLRALGYVGGAEPSRAAAGGRGTRTAGSYNNEGLILREQGRDEEARAAFERALAVDPASSSAEWNLSELLLARGDKDGADRRLLQALGHGLPDGPRQVVARAQAYRRSGEDPRAQALAEAAARVRPQDPELLGLRGRGRLEARDCAGALRDFAAAEKGDGRSPQWPAAAGLALLCLERPAEARAAFQRSLGLDPDQPQLRRTLDQLPR